MKSEKIRIIKEMLAVISTDQMIKSEVIIEGAPIISFGHIGKSKIATMGLNPSDQEFYDSKGVELDGIARRFHTLKSLDIKNWKNASESDFEKILILCEEYFYRNPYDRWFKSLNYIISGTGFSFYDAFNSACHLDLVPFATKKKWGSLTELQKKHLLQVGSKFLADIINNGSIELIILNGRSVIKNMEVMIGCSFSKKEYKAWALPRLEGAVRGEAYTGKITKLGNNPLNRCVKVLGYNHNIQSSFGVTNAVKGSIKNWITREAEKL
ncbi:hypothetical protein [Cellvibrio sp. PSBB006]|uniref:hypothetical protein n=1 Tax=Cellvibrio sp. PSBB006 TaxID=1987723 RepID=UPI000B3B1F1B|nr:hypothetical protein [Cellvibrio sp. PSBB006]ARU28668.1 hypothetical protein CBR65_15115 [Cellvibrio sp. PSBB006]